MQFVEQMVRDLAKDIVKSRRYNYSQEALYNFVESNPNTSISSYRVKNKRSQHLETIIFQNNNSKTSTCIVYAHGLGSNKIEILPLLEHFKDKQYDFCAFDFSGSGRSEGEKTTYGLLEQDDVLSVMGWLDQLKVYNKYVLWGRSMGAVSIILSQSKHFNPKVQCIILDSPFSSFQKVALELASKKSFVPSFMLQICLEFLKKHFTLNQQHNPFSINVCDHIKNIKIKILLMYSKIDNIVSCDHSKSLKECCLVEPLELEIAQDHNSQRSKEVINKIINFISTEIRINSRAKRPNSQSRNRGISLTSKEKHVMHHQNHRLLYNKTSKLQLANPKHITSQRDYNVTETVNTSFSINSQIPISLNQTFHKSKASLQNQTYLQPTQLSAIEKKISINNNFHPNVEKMNWFVNKQNMKPHINYLRKNRFK